MAYIFDDASGSAAHPAEPTLLAGKIDKEHFGLTQAAFKLMNSSFHDGGFRWAKSTR